MLCGSDGIILIEQALEGRTHRRLRKADVRQELHIDEHVRGRHRVVERICEPRGEGVAVNCMLGASHMHRQLVAMYQRFNATTDVITIQMWTVATCAQ